MTVSALIANGQVAQISYHLNLAMDNGLTQTQAAEVVTQLAFYAGWPNAFSALPVFRTMMRAIPMRCLENITSDAPAQRVPKSSKRAGPLQMMKSSHAQLLLLRSKSSC